MSEHGIALTLSSRRATVRFARRLAGLLEPGDFVFFEGPLGAGKTFMSRAVLRALGLPARISVTSPTFALLHLYKETRLPVIHSDLYRLKSHDDVVELGMAELAQEIGAVALIEWGEQWAETLCDAGIVIRITRGDKESTRHIQLESFGLRGAAIEKHLESLENEEFEGD